MRPLFFLVAILLFVAALYPRSGFLLEAQGRQCYIPAQEFELQWRHSVEHQLWRDHYRFDQGKILLDRSYIQTFGAGTPSDGEPLNDAPDGFVGYRQHLTFSEIRWMISSRMQGTLRASGKEIPLYRHYPDYTEILITPLTTFAAAFTFGRTCYD